MTNLELILRFAALFVLSGYLLYRHRQRVLSDSERRNPEAWAGHGINTTDLQKKLEGVRNVQCAAKPRAAGFGYRKKLFDLATHSISRFSYFRHREGKKESEPLSVERST